MGSKNSQLFHSSDQERVTTFMVSFHLTHVMDHLFGGCIKISRHISDVVTDTSSALNRSDAQALSKHHMLILEGG